MAFFSVSCEDMDSYVSIPYELNDVYTNIQQLEGNRYVKNAYYSQAEFDRHFNIAVTGEGNLKKAVDFSRNFAVTITGPDANVYRTIEIYDILQKESTLYVRYAIKDHETLQHSMRPCVVASISRAYIGFDIAFQDVTGLK